MNKYFFNIKNLTEEDYNFYYDNMTDLRREKVSRLKLTSDKLRTVTGEMLVKKHFGNDSIIDVGKFGKPFISNKNGEFSISHSEDMVLVAVSDAPVGADIEKIRKINPSVIRKICNNEEAAYINSGKTDYEKNIRLLEIWTFKEAYFKFKGTGITDFLKVSCFDENIKREKIITKDYVIHIVEKEEIQQQ